MQVNVPIVAPYSTQGATITGSGDVWGDFSDATHITINDSIPPVANNGRGWMQARTVGDFPPVPGRAEVWVRFKSTGPVPHVRLVLPGSGVSADGQPAITDPVAGWMRSFVDIPNLIREWSAGFEVYLQLSSQFIAGARCVIYEARVSLIWYGDAPACQKFPRDDGLGVGAGQHYPPPKSQQRGNRWAGSYY